MIQPSPDLFPKTRSGRRASQRADELTPFLALLKERRVRSYLEIGARHGDTFFDVMRSLPAGSCGVAVDLGGGAWGTPRSVKALKEACADLRSRGYGISLVLGDSREPDVIRSVRKVGLYDAILIDGDHRYAGVKADWENYGGMGKMVAFHDIAGIGETSKDGKAMPVDVYLLWRELKFSIPHKEFIGRDSKMGIGVLFP